MLLLEELSQHIFILALYDSNENTDIVKEFIKKINHRNIKTTTMMVDRLPKVRMINSDFNVFLEYSQ
jgi:hypothetical protein